jgi:hypothetical protein
MAPTAHPEVRAGTPATPPPLPHPDPSAPAHNTRQASAKAKITGENVITLLTHARDKLKGLKTMSSGPNSNIKKEVTEFMTALIDFIKSPTPNPPTNSVTPDVKQDLKDIKQMLTDLTTARSKTWAQVAAQPPKMTLPPERAIAIKERQKSEITISIRSTDESTKNRLSNMSDQAITEKMRTFLQSTSNKPDDSDAICAAQKTTKQSIKIRCMSSEAADKLKEVDWSGFASGAVAIKPQYGVVIHGASKADVPFNGNHVTEENINREIETTNLKRFTIKKITPLHKYSKNPDAPTQSIVLQLSSPDEADECIMNGIFIGMRLHHVEKYMPQFQIKQCFNCYSYGHRADDCSKKQVCGKCSKDDHKTRECQNPNAKCVHCEGEHPAWHNTCTTRKREIEKLEAQRERQSSYFTQ